MPKLVLEEPKRKPRLVLDEPPISPDYGRVALPKEKLPGVWDYDKQLDQLLGDPEIDIEDMLPLDVRYDFGRIVGMTEKPDETKDKMATSLFYSVEFGIPPSVSFSILDELNKIAFDKSIPASNAWGRIKQRYRTGKAQVQLMDVGFDILKGTWQDWEKYDRSVKNIEKLQSGMTIDQRKEFRSFFEKLVGASAELAPFGLEAAKEMPLGAGIGGTIFGIGAAIIAGISPTIGEEALIPSAVFVGMKLGAGVRGAIRVGQLEAGGMFLELANMKDQYGNRIDPRIAIVTSHAVGAINGGIELAEWQILLGTFGIGRKLFDKSVTKVTHRLFTQGTLKELIARKALDYSIALGAETLQEIEQETTNIVFGELAKELNDAREGTDFKPISAEDLRTRYREVTVESMRAFGLMVLPGTTISGALEFVGQKRVEAAVKVEKPAVKEVKAPPTKPIAEPEKIIHTIREMTPEEIAEDEAFWKDFPEIKKGLERVAERVPSLVALQDTLKKRIDLLKKVQLGVLTQEEADVLTEKFAEAAKLRIEAPTEAIPAPEPLPKPITPEKAVEVPAKVKTGRIDLSPEIFKDEEFQWNKKSVVEAMVKGYKEGNKTLLARPISVVPDGKGGVDIIEGSHRAEAAKIAGVKPPIVIFASKAELKEMNAPEVDALAKQIYEAKPEAVVAPDVTKVNVESVTGGFAYAAVDKEGNDIGRALITVIDAPKKEIHITGFFVKEGFRRKGVGTSIINKIKQDFPDTPIRPYGIQTKEGEKFFAKVLAKPEAEPTKIVIPESEKEWAKRSKVVKKELEKEIESIDIYQDEIRAQGERAEEFQVGRIYFEKKYKGEIDEAMESHPSLRLHITYDKTKSAPWDGVIQERLGRYLEGVEATQAHMDVSEFLERVAEVTEHRKKIGKLNLRALDALADSGDIYFETLAAKYDMMQQGFTAEEMNENIREIALDYPEVPTDYVEKLLVPIVEGEPSVEAKQRMVEEVEAKARPLRQRIHAIAAKKGLTKKDLSDLKLKHTGYRKLTGKISKKKISLEQLQKLLKAVQKARPKQVGYKKVITKKTENKIQSLKENLTKKTQMTERHFDEILEIEVHGKEPKYIDAKSFITETEGKDILRRMLDTAEIVRLTKSFEQAIAKNAEITDRVKLLDSRIEKAPKRDPYSLESMRYYNQQAEIKTGAPIFTSYMDLMDTHLEITKTRTATWKRLEKATEKFKEIAKDEEALQRVSDYIAAQSTLKEKPPMPEDITNDEIKLAKEIQKILEEYRIKVRVAKFYNWYYYNQPIPDHDRYVKEITKAVDIYESKGKEELIEYLETQEWGVVKSGYEPLEIIFHKIRPYTTGPTAVGKGHIKIRTDIEYHKQERNILQRLSSYMRQIDMLYNLSPKINAYIRLWDDNAGKFSDWGKVKNDVEIFIRNLKRYSIEGGFFQRVLSRAYSQAMRVIIMPSPVLSFRNLFQNAAFEHDKTILIDPRNKNLTSSDIEYLETYVLQTRAMVEEYFMLGEKPLPGLRTLTRMIDRIKIYPYSDIANRHWSFWAKTNQVDRALKADTVKQMMTEAKFEDMTELEQRRALAILARDGKEAMSQYVGRVHVDDIHFLYERAQRSPAEMTSLGKIVGNLMLFPRAYGEKLAHVANKALKGKTSQEQWRGLKTLFAVIGGGMIAGSIYMKITGRKRNPYNPLEVLAFRPGGLAWGSIEAATEIYANMLSAIKGDSRALAALTVAIPRAADMFIPFYDYTLRAIEAATDQKNIDRKALRQLRMMVDKEYKIRGGAYKVKRTALKKWQYLISGAGVDEKEPVKSIKRRKVE